MSKIVFLINRSTGKDAGSMPADLFYNLDPKWRHVLQVIKEVSKPPEVVALEERLKTKASSVGKT
jgi:hypothetical protein